MPIDDDDELREVLLDAACRVFAREGYEGTRIGDIVRESGLSTGAVYGRFRSKDDLLREAVVRHSRLRPAPIDGATRMADVLLDRATAFDEPLTLDEAVRLEAHVAARREPAVARALDEAAVGWRASLDPLITQAFADGTFAEDIDPDAVAYFIRTVGLGLLLQRAAGSKAPDAAVWSELMTRVLASIGTTDPPVDRPPHARSATSASSARPPLSTHEDHHDQHLA